MQKLHMLAFRQMLRKIHMCQLQDKPDHSKINLHVVHAVLKRAGVDMELDEVGFSIPRVFCLLIIAM